MPTRIMTSTNGLISLIFSSPSDVFSLTDAHPLFTYIASIPQDVNCVVVLHFSSHSNADFKFRIPFEGRMLSLGIIRSESSFPSEIVRDRSNSYGSLHLRLFGVKSERERGDAPDAPEALQPSALPFSRLSLRFRISPPSCLYFHLLIACGASES